ncbi:TFIIB-type zinc ribbon-containing protein [Paenibacillus spongiae]|uniref:TFIIB-type zinc ribbon-containing protein n=1 Tax=Paenibacillus spongiae TaxID=2909671 RepID=UPI0035A2426D
MKCPVCSDVRMREVEKDGVMIDVCPDCKGVWLDRGELDKLMQGMRQIQDDYDRLEEQYYRGGNAQTIGGNAQTPPPPPAGGYGQAAPQGGYVSQQPQQGHYGNQSHPNGGYGHQGHNGGYGHKYGYDKYGRPKKKKTMIDVLGDLFD